MDLREMRAALAAKKAKGKAAVAEYSALHAKADRSEADNAAMARLDAELTALEADVAALDAQIEAEERLARRAGVFAVAQAAPAAQAPARGYQPARTMNEPNPERTFGFAHMAEFANSVRNAVVNPSNVDDRLFAAPTNVHQNAGTSGEGFLVPPQFRETIWELVFSAESLLGRMTVEPSISNVVQIAKDETTPWGSAGVQAAWRAEGGAMTPSKFTTVGSTVNLHELYAFVSATDELLSDAPRLQSRLTMSAARAITWKAGEAIMWGNGVGQPLGFMAGAAKIAVAKESGQAADTVVAANVLKQRSRMMSAGPRSFWVAHPSVVPQLGVMTIGNQPMWLAQNMGLRDNPDGLLLGRPLMLMDHAKTLGDEGDLVLVDPDGYYAVTKAGGGIDFASSIHLWFDYGVSAFRWTFRLGGQPFLSAAVSPAKGSETRSHFVAIADRA